MFDTHLLNEKGLEEMKTFKKIMADEIENVLNYMPEGRDRSIFKTKIEEAVFFGAKAIAGKEGNYTEIIRY